MAWWEYIPLVSTVGHALEDPPGREVGDYAECKPSSTDCRALGTDIAVIQCQQCVTDKLSNFISDYIGADIAADIFETVVGVTVTQIAEKLARYYAGRGLLATSTAWTGVGIVLAVDGIVDLGIQANNIFQMYEASKQAKEAYCICE